MSLLLFTQYRLAAKSIKSHRARATLTSLGITIGIASITLILSLAGSAQNLIKQQAKALGADLILIRPTITDHNKNPLNTLSVRTQFQKSNLSLKDLATIKNIKSISSIAPISLSSHTINTDSKTTNPNQKTIKNIDLLATTPDFIKIHPLPIKDGTFLSDKTLPNSIVIGRTLSLQLFGHTKSVGNTIKILNHQFIITGVISRTNNSLNINNLDYDNLAIADINQLAKLSENLQIQQINLKTNTDQIETIANQLKETLTKAKSGDQNFEILYGDKVSHPASHLLELLSAVLAFVAGISLIVGGIGIMNILLVAVSERTYEIGIRKSVGATSSHIFLQFLLESLIISFVGAIFGLLLGYAAAFLTSSFFPLPPFIDYFIVLIAISTSLLTGTIFGLLPAIKAATKDPINALKHYR